MFANPLFIPQQRKTYFILAAAKFLYNAALAACTDDKPVPKSIKTGLLGEIGRKLYVYLSGKKDKITRWLAFCLNSPK